MTQCNIQYKAPTGETLSFVLSILIDPNLRLSDDGFFIHFDGLIGVSAVGGQTRIDASPSWLFLWVIARRVVGWTHPQSAVQHGEDDAIQDENPIQDKTYIHPLNAVS